MVPQILDLLGETISTVASWFNEILVKTGGKPAWITAIIVVMSYKYLLSPVFGAFQHAASDTIYNAKRKGDK